MSSKKIFISGSISIKQLPNKAKETLDEIIRKEFEILVGDARGVDSLVQDYCNKKKYYNVTIHHIDDNPRYLANSKFKKEKSNYLESEDKTKVAKLMRKDIKMTKKCDYSFVIWDGKSNGSYENIMRTLGEKKFVKVYLIESDECRTSKDSNFQTDIEKLYEKNAGMIKEKCRNLLKQSYPENKNLKNAEKFNIFLADHKIIKKEDKIYIPTDEYKKYFIEKLSKGKFISYNFTNELYEIIEELIKKEQPTLF
ncbi:hypothetical protein [Campylobacter lanienae]|uniref:hypothetical protein n=1 Tax=Campylobacter lanienae TaxID=75658 RepID=UPI000BB3F133|nr:hypothetical protein [Campylobacter lanienae]TWO13783.1 hypothetical protein ZA02_07225 [Campylobacter lanienae]